MDIPIRVNPIVPEDTRYVTDQDGYILGGMRYDDIDGWQAYWPDEARNMAITLGHADENGRLKRR